MTLRLYDLAGADPNRRFSPYCWRVRLAPGAQEASGRDHPVALHRKGGDRAVRAAKRFQSWSTAIAGSPIPGPSRIIWRTPIRTRRRCSAAPPARRLTRHYSSLADALVTAIFPFIALDILQHLADKDRDYFRGSREQRVGTTLEAFVANRDAGLAGFRASLAPLRHTLKTQPFFGGDEPLYADYAVFGQFQWARCISPFALLEEGDPVKLVARSVARLLRRPGAQGRGLRRLIPNPLMPTKARSSCP